MVIRTAELLPVLCFYGIDPIRLGLVDMGHFLITRIGEYTKPLFTYVNGVYYLLRVVILVKLVVSCLV